MRINIRSKLIFAISLLMVIVFSAAAYLFISEKKVEMSDDIFRSSVTFGKLTGKTVADNYDLYLKENGFVYFNRELQEIFEQNNDISAIEVVSYEGEILYDSREDSAKKYEGEKRLSNDADVLKQIKAENISIKTDSGRVVFIKEDLNGDIYFVDENEKEVDAIEKGTFLSYLVVPASEKYSVIYYLDYTNLENRVNAMMNRIIYLAIFGVMLGMIFSFIMSQQFTKPISKLVHAAYKLAKGDFTARTNIKTHDELRFLGKAFNQMAADLEVSVENKLYKDRVAHELQLAAEIQKEIIPVKIPEISGIDVASGLIPAEEIGGDIYDFLKVGEDKMLMYLGDVTGHGVPAGIVSSIASALFYGYSEIPDLKKIITEVNRVLNAKTMPNMFMTLCLMCWDSLQKKFSYVSAGHEQIVHYKAASKEAVLRAAGGVALGMVGNISTHIAVEEVDFEEGDFLVIYSDGIPEAWRNEKENYGMPRLVNFVKECGNFKNALQIKEAILKDVHDFAAGYKQQDDITIIVIKRN